MCYATVGDYLNFTSNLEREPYIPHISHSLGQGKKSPPVEKFHPPVTMLEKFPEKIKPQTEAITSPLELRWKTGTVVNTADPKIWGPAFWFSLHNSAVHYPLASSPLVKERMKYRLLAIPYEIPCPSCRSHASSFIEKYREKLDTIVSGRHELGKFYVEMHNQVNKRFGKPEWSYDQAYKLYSGGAKITYLQ